MIQEEIKKATASDHKKLEERMYVQDMMAGSLTAQQYKHMIETNFLVHAEAEEKIFSLLQPETRNLLNIKNREKLFALQKDVQVLNIEAKNIGSLSAQLNFDSEAEALGAMYVMEGATLGGQVILKLLSKNEKTKHLNNAFNYFTVYGKEVGANWKQFLSVINNRPADELPALIKGSEKMYAFFNDVHNKHLPASEYL